MSLGHEQVVEYLCSLPPERGVDPSAQDNTAFGEAAYSGHLLSVCALCHPSVVSIQVRKTTPRSSMQQSAATCRLLSSCPLCHPGGVLIQARKEMGQELCARVTCLCIVSCAFIPPMKRSAGHASLSATGFTQVLFDIHVGFRRLVSWFELSRTLTNKAVWQAKYRRWRRRCQCSATPSYTHACIAKDHTHMSSQDPNWGTLRVMGHGGFHQHNDVTTDQSTDAKSRCQRHQLGRSAVEPG